MARSSKRRRDNNSNPPAAKHARSVDAAKRTAVRTHGTADKREELRLKMHLERTKRSIQQLRERLCAWDDEEEEIKKKKANEPPPRKKKRTDPSTWKLKGAAKPAHSVYDFDVRYVDPYVQDHERAKAKAKRQVNLLTLGNLGSRELGREFLSLLMQYAHLSEEAHHYKDAQNTYLECLQLDGTNITNARDALLRLYILRERYVDAYDLGIASTNSEADDITSAMRFNTALAAFALHHNSTSSKLPTHDKTAITLNNDTLQEIMTKAIRSNIFLAHYIAHYDVFATVMECQDELDDEGPQSLLEEAIEYANDDTLIRTWKTLGADHSIPSILKSMDWRAPLERLIQDDDQSNRSMFAEMFRTAMEMVETEQH